MNDTCTLCDQPYQSHLVRYQARFKLWCPDDSPYPVHLGATIEAAQQQLEIRCGADTTVSLIEDFGRIEIAHHIFALNGARHVTGDGCAACPPPWPVKCADHGGCEGGLHLTLRNRKSKKVYGRSSELLADAVKNAVRNLLLRPHEPRRPTPYEAFAECDHCGSRPSQGEVIRALVA